MSKDWIEADWPAPAGVVAGCTLRRGGVSKGAYRSLNIADHVEDGRMRFDYKMQPGVIDSTNALRLMKANGLPVDVPEQAQSPAD